MAFDIIPKRGGKAAGIRQILEHFKIGQEEIMAFMISQMMNPGGFTSSIRSIREIGTTNPKKLKANRVE